MAPPCGYAVARVHADSDRLDRTAPPAQGPAALVVRVRDRLGTALGWKLKPLTDAGCDKPRLARTRRRNRRDPTDDGHPGPGRHCRRRHSHDRRPPTHAAVARISEENRRLP